MSLAIEFLIITRNIHIIYLFPIGNQPLLLMHYGQERGEKRISSEI
jgi:hypothetical protein